MTVSTLSVFCWGVYVPLTLFSLRLRMTSILSYIPREAGNFYYQAHNDSGTVCSFLCWANCYLTVLQSPLWLIQLWQATECFLLWLRCQVWEGECIVLIIAISVPCLVSIRWRGAWEGDCYAQKCGKRLWRAVKQCQDNNWEWLYFQELVVGHSTNL